MTAPIPVDGSPQRPRVGVATAAAFPDLDEDGPMLLGALSTAGLLATPAIWTDAAVDWSGFDLVLVRSTWDYTDRLPDFLSWADRVARVTRLANPAAVLRWNTDKRYLSDLAARGVPVVDTVFLEPGRSPEWPRWPHVVVKPAVSAGSKDTARYGPEDLGGARAHAEQLLDDGRVVMVQPYLSSVETAGETALIYFRGAFSHAIRKGPMLTGDRATIEGLYLEEQIQPRSPSEAELAVAESVLAAVPGAATSLAYARVDLLATENGPVLLELELTEPSVFLRDAEGAADRFAAAVSALLP